MTDRHRSGFYVPNIPSIGSYIPSEGFSNERFIFRYDARSFYETDQSDSSPSSPDPATHAEAAAETSALETHTSAQPDASGAQHAGSGPARAEYTESIVG